MSEKQILLVDDEAMVGESVRLLLQLDGHSVEFVTDGGRAMEKYAPGRYDLVVTDSRMPGMSGLQLAGKIRRLNPAQRIMMLTGFPPAGPMPDIDLVMLKPFSGAELRSAVTRLTTD